MKKQTFYPNFIPRIFSTAIDMFILSILTAPIMSFVQKQFFIWKFKPYLITHGINASDTNAMYLAFTSPEFEPYLTLSNFLLYGGIVLLTQIILMGGYFIYFWTKFGQTPGKFITGMKVVDEITFDKLSLWQSIKRFLGTPLFPVSILFIFFSEKNQSLHDRMAGAIVIKR